MNIKQQVHLYVFHHPGCTGRDCAAATGINPSSVSSSATTLRNEGMMKPSDGSGQMLLTKSGLEAALKLDIAPTAAPAPVADHQSERTTYADVATEEDGDTVQTSCLDVANAEIARMQAEVAKLTDERDMYRYSHDAAAQQHSRMCKEFGLKSADPETLEGVVCSAPTEIRNLRGELESVTAAKDNYYAELHEIAKRLECHTDYTDRIAAIDRLKARVAHLEPALSALLALRAAIEKHGIHAHPDDVDAALARLRHLERQSAAPVVRLEWGKWDGDEPNCVKLWAFIGGIANTVAQITDDHEFVSFLWLTHPCGDQTIRIAGDDLTKVSAILAANLAMVGLTMPPVPALPEKAA